MKAEKSDLLTAGAIAQQLGLPPTKVKKAIGDLKIKPTAKKGACSYYSKDVLPKIKSAAK
jgi:predicted ArsR family transcriptional regulator